MTCKEKLKKEHPGWNGHELYETFENACPSNYRYLDEPEWCNPCDRPTCDRCWERQIPEEKPTKYNPIEKAYKLLVDFRDSQHTECEVDIDELIGYLGEALDKQPEENLTYEHQGEPIGKVADVRKLLDGLAFKVEPTTKKSDTVSETPEDKHCPDSMPLEVVAEYLTCSLGLNKKALEEVAMFKRTNCTLHLYLAIGHFVEIAFTNSDMTMLLKVADYFRECDANRQEGLSVEHYIDNAVEHYLKWLRGDTDDAHDCAFVRNLICCIWEVDYREKDGINNV